MDFIQVKPFLFTLFNPIRLSMETITTKYADLTNYIGGKNIPSSGNRWLDVISPIDGTLLSRVPMSTPDDLDLAVENAKKALDNWSKMPIKERVQVFFRYRTLLEKYAVELTQLVSEENGKTLDEARAEIDKSIELTEFACSMPQLIAGEIMEVSKGVECRTERFPVEQKSRLPNTCWPG